MNILQGTYQIIQEIELLCSILNTSAKKLTFGSMLINSAHNSHPNPSIWLHIQLPNKVIQYSSKIPIELGLSSFVINIIVSMSPQAEDFHQHTSEWNFQPQRNSQCVTSFLLHIYPMADINIFILTIKRKPQLKGLQHDYVEP